MKNFGIRSRKLALQGRVQALAEKNLNLRAGKGRKNGDGGKKIHMEVNIFKDQQEMLEIIF